MLNTIWVVNHSGHNIEAAVRDFRPCFVEYLTEGNQNLAEIDRIKYNMFLKFSEPNGPRPAFDYQTDAVLLCGNTLINVIATALLISSEFNCPYLKLLIYDGRRRSYYIKDLDMGGLRQLTQAQIDQFQTS